MQQHLHVSRNKYKQNKRVKIHVSGVVYSGEDTCMIAMFPRVCPHWASGSLLDCGGNRNRDLWLSSPIMLYQLSYKVKSVRMRDISELI